MPLAKYLHFFLYIVPFSCRKWNSLEDRKSSFYLSIDRNFLVMMSDVLDPIVTFEIFFLMILLAPGMCVLLYA